MVVRLKPLCALRIKRSIEIELCQNRLQQSYRGPISPAHGKIHSDLADAFRIA